MWITGSGGIRYVRNGIGFAILALNCVAHAPTPLAGQITFMVSAHSSSRPSEPSSQTATFTYVFVFHSLLARIQGRIATPTSVPISGASYNHLFASHTVTTGRILAGFEIETWLNHEQVTAKADLPMTLHGLTPPTTPNYNVYAECTNCPSPRLRLTLMCHTCINSFRSWLNGVSVVWSAWNAAPGRRLKLLTRTY